MKKMKNGLIPACLLLVALLLGGCEKEGELTRNPPGRNVTVSTEAQLSKTGQLEGRNGYRASGTAELLLDEGVYKLRFTNLNVSNGPDLRVYLSRGTSPQDIINVGRFSNGQTELAYTVPEGRDPSTYPFVLV